MKQLIISATAFEMGRIPDNFSKQGSVDQQVSFLISGIGIHATTFHLTRYLMQNKVDRVIQVGISGSFSTKWPVGAVVEVTSDCLADFGYDDRGTITGGLEAGWLKAGDPFYPDGWIGNEIQLDIGLAPVRGITVNLASGSTERIRQLVSKYSPDTESMEGAAAAYVCRKTGIPFFQIRAISNPVAVRNEAEWNIPLALNNLHSWLTSYLHLTP